MVEDAQFEQIPAEHAVPQDDRLARLHDTLSGLAQMQPAAELDAQSSEQNERITRLTSALGKVNESFLGLDEVDDDGEKASYLQPLTEEQSHMVVEHMGIAHNLARRYRHRGQSDDDLLQVASIGLIKSVQRFDPELGNSFATFATPTILGELRRHFRDHGWAVRVPRQTQEQVLRVPKARDELTQKLKRAPTNAELAEELEMDQDTLSDVLIADNSYGTTSLDTPVYRYGNLMAPEDTIGNEADDFEEVENKMRVEEMLAGLNPRERLVISARAGLPPFEDENSQAEIAEMIGVSQMQVSRLITAVLLKLSRVLSDVEV
ncbi:MAG TPA: SigB/SigF/SigG family RNA polymerase sigma factor [Candidatus Saccharimonadales bacterium]|nr:SigB/SigF/SigG family RNA polymerase sigma factor [Candidatus Saccharimonadales bacterium]